MTITGANFVGVSGVSFGEIPAGFTVNDGLVFAGLVLSKKGMNPPQLSPLARRSHVSL